MSQRSGEMYKREGCSKCGEGGSIRNGFYMDQLPTHFVMSSDMDKVNMLEMNSLCLSFLREEKGTWPVVASYCLYPA